MMAVFRRDLRRYFGGMFGYTVIALQLLPAGLFVLFYNLMARSVDFSLPLIAMQTVLTLILPFLSLRATARGRGEGSEELLLSLPTASPPIPVFCRVFFACSLSGLLQSFLSLFSLRPFAEFSFPVLSQAVAPTLGALPRSTIYLELPFHCHQECRGCGRGAHEPSCSRLCLHQLIAKPLLLFCAC